LRAKHFGVADVIGEQQDQSRVDERALLVVRSRCSAISSS
jgi:hypothetical protein